MKSTTKSSSGIFKMVPQFLQKSTDRLHLDPGGSLPTFSWMIWHHTGFRSLFSLFRVPSGFGDYGVVCLYVFCSSTIFVPAGSAILKVLIWYRTFRIFQRNFVTSTAWLHPPGRSLLSSTNESGRSRFGCHHPGVLFQQYAIPGARTKVAAQKEVTARKHVTAQKHEFLPA